MSYTLDTSAVLAYFLDEPGADEVKEILKSAENGDGEVFVSFMTFMEVLDMALSDPDGWIAGLGDGPIPPSSRDMKGLVACEEGFGNRFQMGIILYGGTECMPLAPKRVAIPIGFAFGAELV